MHIGIYPGSFDPLHEGHIAFAEETAEVCGLECVVFLPEAMPRNKPNATPLAERLEALHGVLADHPTLDATSLNSPRFTVQESLPELLKRFPDQQLTLLIGSDVVKSLEHWVDIGMLLPHVSLAIGLRHPDTHDDVLRTCQTLSEKYPSFTYRIIEAPHAHLSSRQLRASNINECSA